MEKNHIMRSLMICISHQILFGWSDREEWDGRGIKRIWGRVELYIGFWWGNLREGDHLENPGLDGRILLRWIFRKWDVGEGGGGLDWSGSEWRQVAGTCKCGKEPSDSIKWIGGSRTHSPTHQTAHTDTCETYQTVYITLSLMMNPRGSKHVGDNIN